jgi:hypothetical protein
VRSSSASILRQPLWPDARLRSLLEIDRFKRDINLTEFAAAYGYQRIAAQSSRASVAMGHPGTSDKIIVTKGKSGHWIYFSVRDDRDKGTIIDFLRNRTGHASREFAVILAELRPWIGEHRRTVAPELYQSHVSSVVRDPGAVRREFDQASESPTNYYLNTRGIRAETLQHPRFRGTWREDRRGNALFPHRGPTGAVSGCEKKNHRYTGFTTGGAKTAWFSHLQASDRLLVITESGIDALSFHQIHKLPEARYLSTGGSLSALQRDLLRRAIVQMAKGSTAVAATDNDKEGHKMAAFLAELARDVGVAWERPLPPIGKDWNDTLRHHEQDYIRSLARQRGPAR